MSLLPRKRMIRKKRGRGWTSESSVKANRARWDADRLRRDLEEPEREREMAERRALNLPSDPGDVLGALQWTDATGRVRRWVVRIGDRADRITLEIPGGERTGSHGWTWALNKLRKHLTR
jgi:hypothetical protein